MSVLFYDGTTDFYLNDSEFNGPRDKGKLEPVYTKLYELVKDAKPNNIVELGVGSGACTVAMARGLQETNSDGRMIGFDTFDSWGGIRTVYQKLKSRNLDDYIHNMREGNVFKLWVENPTEFDFLWIDIDNTWRTIYDVVFGNDEILNQIKAGSPVYIEGGANAHPRMNERTLNDFHNSLDKEVFKYTLLSGLRVSISKLELI
jgi:hypothetical protein|tara:strand:+ start:2279 stop:2887 length:609 start_codon:yes stop_codon:yes gene_type:complete